MRKLFRTLALCLIVTLTFAILPAEPAFALPKSFNRTRADKYTGKKVILTIGDMKFNGTIRCTALTDAEFDKLVKDLMDKMNMTDDEFEKLCRQVDKLIKNLSNEFTKADYERIKSNWYDMAGAVPGADKVTSVIQILDQIVSDQPWDAGVTGAEAVYGVPGYGQGKALVAIAQEWMRNQQKYQDMQNGLNAQRRLNDFYSMLDTEIMKFMEKNKDKIRLEFKDAKDTKTFDFMDGDFDETWTVNMSLKKVAGAGEQAPANAPTWSSLVSGLYQGDFTVDIKYDFTDMAARVSGYYGDIWNKALVNLVSPVVIVPSQGTSDSKRTLAGKAEAYVDINKQTGRMSLRQEKESRNINESGHLLDVFWTQIDGSYQSEIYFTFEIHGDNDRFYFSQRKYRADLTDLESGKFQSLSPGLGEDDGGPWEITGSMMDRGNNLSKTKLQVLP